MARRNTVNFLQIANALKSALGICADNPDASYVQELSGSLKNMAKTMSNTEERLDRAYGVWREAIRQRLLAAKHLWQDFERVRDEIGEYDLVAKPSGRISYWEIEFFLDRVEELIAFLEELDENEVPEAEEWLLELKAKMKAVQGLLEEEELSLTEYRRLVPARRQAIYRAMHLVEDFERVHRDYA